jgi:hypothetical protein
MAIGRAGDRAGRANAAGALFSWRVTGAWPLPRFERANGAGRYGNA